MRKFILSTSLLLLSLFTIAQNPSCGADQALQHLLQNGTLDYSTPNAFSAAVNHWRANNPAPYGSTVYNSLVGSSGCKDANYVLPVVVHIVHTPLNSPGHGDNISNNQVLNQIAVLNAKMAETTGTKPLDTKIRFGLAKIDPNGTSTNGIVRHASARFTTMEFDTDSAAAMFKAYNWDESRYINIYVVNTIVNPASPTAIVGGFTFYPTTIGYVPQGIVVRHDWFGDYTTYPNPMLNANSEGEVLLHEIGHYLGVYHPWNDTCSGSTYVDCATKGDLCCDVAQSSQEQFNCSGYNTCPDSSDLDAIHNYMSYTPDGCRSEFTQDQLSIMYATLELYRTQLWNPVSVNALALDECVWTSRFVGPTIACVGDIFTYTAYELTSGVNYTWTITHSSGTSTSASGGAAYTTVLNTAGKYSIKLQVADINTGKTRTRVMADSLEVVDCQPLASTKANWYFGDHAGLSFYENKVVRGTTAKIYYPSNIRSFEGSASISDSLGNLIGYVGGINASGESEINGLGVFGKNNRPILNDTINGSSSSSQSLLFIPFHSDANLYNIFSRAKPLDSTGNVASQFTVFEQAIFDKSVSKIIPKPEQYGKILHKNNQIKDSLGISPGFDESISAIKRCDDSTYWLTIINPNQSAAEFYIVNDSSVSFSHRVPVYLSTYYYNNGFIKYSPDGNWVWLGNSLYRFCRSEGSLELVFNDSLINGKQQYGVSFSPDSRLLYRSVAYYTGSNQLPTNKDSDYSSFLLQYSLLSPNVEGSERYVTKLQDLESENYLRSLQLGPDSKIYIAANLQPYLAVINEPNVRVTTNECGFKSIGPLLTIGGDGGISRLGLPNFIDAQGPNEGGLGFTVKNITCFTKLFIPSTCCATSYRWYFGYGDTNYLEQPVHTFDSAGTYIVTLIIGKDTFIKTVHIGIMPQNIALSGSTSVCGGSPYSYTTSVNKQYEYVWSVNGGSGLVSQPWQIDVMWSNNGYVKLVVNDKETGCSDTIIKNVVLSGSITNNTVSPTFQYVCDSNSNIVISGTMPSGGNGIFAYSWYGSRDNGLTYSEIDGATNPDYQASKDFGYTHFYRNVTSSGCTSVSNIAEIKVVAPLGNIQVLKNPCVQGDSVILLADSLDLSPSASTTIYWQKSLDSIFWVDAGLGSVRLATTQTEIKAFYRQVVHISQLNCLLYSNVLTIKPDVYITREPKDYYTCDEFQGNWFFDIGVSNENNIPLQYWWRIKDANSNSWSQNSVGSDTVISAAGHSSSHPSNHLDSVQFVINTSCGVLYSRKAVIRVVSDVPNISYLAFKNAQVGVISTFEGSITGHYDSLKWQVQDANSSQWEDLPGGNTATFNYVFNAVCFNKYRLVAYNNCGITYSNTPSLTISDPSDIWLKDRPQDVGVELYAALQASLLINSPDIWNRRANDNGTVHQTPDYSPTNPNYVYVKLRNKGTTQTGATPLYLYWTLAEIGQEIWPNDWTDNPNNQLINRLNNLPFPKGSEINEIAIMVPAINPGDSVIVSVPWFPPSPSNYTYATALNTFKPFEKLNICLLARLEHCEQYPHKMTFNEDLDTSVVANVSRNNNIATKNFEVVDKDVDSDGGVTGGTVITTFPQTSYDTVPCIKMILKKPLQDGTFILEMRRVYLDDEPTMTFEEYQQIISMDFDTCLVPINPYSQVGRFALTPKFIPINGWQSLPQELFEFVMVLSNNYGEEYGAFEYHIDNRDGSFNTLDYFWSPPPSLPETNHLLLSPNPTVSTFSLELDQETKDNMLGQLGTVIVADGYGYPHIVLENIDAQASTLISLQGYKAGVYNVRFEISGQVFYKYLVKTDE